MLEDTVGEYSRGLAVVLSVGGVGVGVKTGIVLIFIEKYFFALCFLYFEVWTRRRVWEGVSG